MGIIRVLLALAVVFAHSYGFVFTGGQLAVQLFYVISGYLISLILLSNKSYTNVRSFYLNRSLRLFPIYWVVALLSLLFFVISWYTENDRFFHIYDEVGMWGAISLFVSNITLIGQDWIMFTGVRDGVFQFVADFKNSDVTVHEGLLVPQAWTLGVEISFYLIAPFIIRKKIFWMGLLVFSLMLRVYLIWIGVGVNSSFSYRFFPSELRLFLLGVFSQQILMPCYQKYGLLDNQFLVRSITALGVLYVSLFFVMPLPHLANSICLITFMVLALPLLAKFQQDSAIDNWIGNLSYPIYICHLLVIWIVTLVAQKFSFFETFAYYLLVVCVTIFFAWCLEVLINKRVDRVRSMVRKGMLFRV